MISLLFPRRLFAAMLLVILCSSGRSQSDSFPNEYGWVWQLKPVPPPKGMFGTGDFLLTVNELKDGSLLLTAAHGDKLAGGLHSLVAIAIDSVGHRFEFNSQGTVSSNGITLRSFKLPPTRLLASHVKYIGLEKLTEDNLRTLLAPAAFEKLKAAGQQALKYPEVGKPYDFDLITIDGSKISSRVLLGKVVLLDFWASWCSPCMAKMPKLKELYDKLKGRGFEVVGLNHDNSMETAKKFTLKENLPWPIVLAPTTDQHREWWEVASGVSTLPRLLLIDRKGILRADVSPHELPQELEKLVGE